MDKTEAKKSELGDDIEKLTTKIGQTVSKYIGLKNDVKQLQEGFDKLRGEQKVDHTVAYAGLASHEALDFKFCQQLQAEKIRSSDVKEYHCATGTPELQASIGEAHTKVPQIEGALSEASACRESPA